MSYIYKFLISKIKTHHFKFSIWAYYILVRGFIEFSYLKHIATIMPPVSPQKKKILILVPILNGPTYI